MPLRRICHLRLDGVMPSRLAAILVDQDVLGLGVRAAAQPHEVAIDEGVREYNAVGIPRGGRWLARLRHEANLPVAIPPGEDLSLFLR